MGPLGLVVAYKSCQLRTAYCTSNEHVSNYKYSICTSTSTQIQYCYLHALALHGEVLHVVAGVKLEEPGDSIAVSVFVVILADFDKH